MTVYVDRLMPWGWVLHGRKVESCHMFTDSDLAELHEMAERIGLRRSWFQDKPGRPHYDLTEGRRASAVEAGAVEIGLRDGLAILRKRAALYAEL